MTATAQLGSRGPIVSPAGGGGATFNPSLEWNFDGASIVDADPGAGKFRFNNLTQGSATQIFINDSNTDGASLSRTLKALNSKGIITSDAQDQILIRQRTDPSRFHVANIINASIDAVGYVKLQISILDSGVAIADTEDCILTFLWAHDQVDIFTLAGAVYGDVIAHKAGEGNGQLADNTDATKMPAFGMVVQAYGTNQIVVQYIGLVSGLGGLGLSAGSKIYVDELGKFTPTAPTDDGTLVQQIGIARDSGSLYLNFQEDVLNVVPEG